MSTCYRRITAGQLNNTPIMHRRQIQHQSIIRGFKTVEISRIDQTTQRRRGMCLRRTSERNLREWAVESVESGGVAIRSDGSRDDDSKVGMCSYAVEDRKIGEDAVTVLVIKEEDRDRAVDVLVAAAFTVVLGVGNRVMYKLALVPLKQYPFFLAQLATFGYVLVYFSILYIRYHGGLVTDEMLSLPKAPFLGVGLLEALAAATGMAAGAILSGASIPILSQSFLVWQILLSVVFLGRRYKFNQLLGCFLVAAGVIITVASGSSAGSLREADIFWSILMIVSFFFQAADTVLKEVIFLDAACRLKGGSVDLFVVNSFGSAFQALFICLLLPFMSKLWGIPFSQLPNYLKDGAACFLNIGTLSSGCDGAPFLPLLFIIVNMGFNISLLHLIKISSAVVSCLASTFSVPLAIYMFTLPLPYMGVSSSLPPGFVAGAIVLFIGLLTYCWTPSNKATGSPKRVITSKIPNSRCLFLRLKNKMIKASSNLPPLLASSPALSVLRSSLIPALNLTSSSSIHHSFLRISRSHTFTTLSKSFAPYLHSLGSFVPVSPIMMTPTHSSSFKLQASFSAGAVNSSDSGKEILVQHLLVKEENLNLLLELQQRIIRGEDLSDLAVEYSICPSKEEGGMLGWVRKGQMVPEFEEAAFGASLNKVVRCKTEFGWHLLQVLSERVGASLEEIQPGELHLKMQDPTFLEEVQLIDVREPEEVEIASWSGFQVLPLSQFGVWGPEIASKFDYQKDTYVMCHHGMRSLQVAKWLQTQGFRKVFNVTGGIHSFATQVDPSVPTY